VVVPIVPVLLAYGMIGLITPMTLPSVSWMRKRVEVVGTIEEGCRVPLDEPVPVAVDERAPHRARRGR
jgi:hypothetical protein